MQLVKLNSRKFPGISIILPDRPNPPGGRGSFEFAMGIEYTLSDASALAVREALNSFPRAVKSNISMQVRPIEIVQPAEPVAAAIAAPVPAAAASDVGAPAEPDPVELADSDLELISIEVEKLHDKTVAQGKPIIEATAGNEELPLQIRKSYLDAVVADPELQKGMKETAQDWLEVLSS